MSAFFNKEKEVSRLAHNAQQKWREQSGLVPKSEKPLKVVLLDGYHTSSPWGYSDGRYRLRASGRACALRLWHVCGGSVVRYCEGGGR